MILLLQPSYTGNATMDDKRPSQGPSFLNEGAINFDDLRMNLESSLDEETQEFDMTSYLNCEVPFR